MKLLLFLAVLLVETLANAAVAPLGGTNTAILRGTAYTTIAAAKAAAIDGDTVFVNPGVYQENNLLKAGCTNFSYFFFPGAWIRFTNAVYSASDTGLGIFDDRGTGQTTNNIYGYLNAYYSTGTTLSQGNNGNTNAIGFLVTTNPNTSINLQMQNVEMEAFPTVVPTINGVAAVPAVFYVSRGNRINISCNDLLFSRLNDTVNAVQDNVGGLYWELGEVYFNFAHMNPVPTSCYGIWPEEPAGVNANNLWVVGKQMESKIYNVGHSPNYKAWYDFNDFSVAGSSAIGCYGGKIYLRAEKISVTSSTLVIDSNQGSGTVNQYWITAQKITAGTGVSWVQNDGGTLHLSVQEYECPAGTLNANGGFKLNQTQSQPTVTVVEGGAASGSGIGVNISAGYALFKNVSLSMTNADNAAYYPAQTSGGTLILQSCKLVAPASTTECIHAGSAQNVGVEGALANVNKSANVTLTPNGGLTVDTNVK